MNNFYFGPHTYSKLVNSFIIANGSDPFSNSIEMSHIFTSTSCDVDSDGNPVQPNQPLLELGGRDKWETSELESMKWNKVIIEY